MELLQLLKVLGQSSLVAPAGLFLIRKLQNERT